MTTDMIELVMNVGRRHGLTPQKLMTLVNVADRESSVDIGRINIVRMQAYFEVPRAESQGVIDSFMRSQVELDGRQVSVGKTGNTQTRAARIPRGNPRGRGKNPRRK